VSHSLLVGKVIIVMSLFDANDILFAGITAIGAMSLVGADVPALMSSIGDITVVGNVAKFAVGFPLIYHYLGGVRHLIWDNNPDLLENTKVEQSSYILVGASVVLSVGLALV
jgi:succinate dehydrogenase (ubiquinone) cytochrome b560 subunit